MSRGLPVLLKLWLGVLGLAVLAAVAHTIRTRTPGEFWLFTALLTLAWQSMIVKWSLDVTHAAGRPLPEASLRGFLRVFSRAVPLAVATYGVLASIKDLYLWLVVADYGLLVSIAAVVFAYPFYLLLTRLRVVYGALEVLVGFTVAGYRLDPTTPFWDLAAFLPFLTAGVYLVVQGFGNISQGLRSPDVDFIRSLFGPARNETPTNRRPTVREVAPPGARKDKKTILKERKRRTGQRSAAQQEVSDHTRPTP